MNYIPDVTIFVFTDGNFLKMATAPIGEGAIVCLFEDKPFRPPQSGHVTHVLDDLALQNLFIYVLCLTKCVQRFMFWTGSECILGHDIICSVQMLWVQLQSSA